MVQIADSKRPDLTHSAARSQSGTCTTFDDRHNLPYIDGHCHVFGQSLTGNPVSTDRMHNALRGLSLTGAGPGLLAFWDIAARFDAVKFLAYSMSREKTNALLVVKGIPSDDEHLDGGAAVPLLLDMGFTPLDTKNFQAQVMRIFDPAKEYEHKCNSDAGYEQCPNYYQPGLKYVWYPRVPETYERTIRRLSEVAMAYPGRFWPFISFDPRRPDGQAYVEKAIGLQGFVGVKFYSRCGWMPLNNGEIHGSYGAALDKRLRKLYTYCTSNDLPLLNHTSPTGFPPDGCLVFPRQYETTSPKVDEPKEGPGFPPYTMPIDKVGAGGDPKAIKPEGTEACIRHALSRVAAYCHYIQKTTSPYAWIPVLREFPKLRICLAHSGGEIATFCRYRSNIELLFKKKDHELDSLRQKLHDNPMVAAGTDFAGPDDDRLHDSLFVKLATTIAYIADGYEDTRESGWFTETWRALASPTAVTVARLGQRLYDALFDSHSAMTNQVVAALKADEKWMAWLRDWREYYTHDWTTKIIELEQTYENVYADIAYLAGEEEDIFCALVHELARDADLGSIMKRRHFIGTDWYMTAIDGMSAATFWKRVQKVIPGGDESGGAVGRLAAAGARAVAMAGVKHAAPQVAVGIKVAGTLRGSGDDGGDHQPGEDTVWERWATKNALKFLNLAPRLNGSGMSTLESFYDGTLVGGPRPGGEAVLPPWWPDLKCYYRERPDSFDDTTIVERRDDNTEVTDEPTFDPDTIIEGDPVDVDPDSQYARQESKLVVDTSYPYRYRAHDSANVEFHVEGDLYDGVLSITMRTQSDDGSIRSEVINGKEQYTRMLMHFAETMMQRRPDEREIRIIKGGWSYGTNFGQFHKFVNEKGMTNEEAAAATWSGKRAAESGYTVVHRVRTYGSLPKYNKIEVMFVRPGFRALYAEEE